MRNRKNRLPKRICCYLISVIMLSMILQVPAFASGRTAAAAADTSVKLLREAVRSAKTDQNVLISPDSILTAMVMAEYGAAGQTLAEMVAAFGGVSVGQYGDFLMNLHKRLAASKKITYSPANSIWYRKNEVTLKKAYLDKMTQYFQAGLYGEPFDATTVRKINSWVKKSTKGKIPSIIDRLDAQDMVLLINAVYFKGKWAEQYDNTVTKKFTSESGKVQKVDTLIGKEKSYVEICGAKGFVKNYVGGDTAFMALLPPKGTSVKNYLKKLTGQDLIKGFKNRNAKDYAVYTQMPEFSYDYDISLKSALQRMGIRNAFSSITSDFSKMSKRAMHIDDVIHKTHIDLNKWGTEAAAVTAVVVRANSAMPGQEIVKKVYLNRPFVYAIVDVKTGVPQFLGVVNKI